MKVIIITEGGKNIGFGHIGRCTALYQAFKERGIIPEMVVKADESVKDLLNDINYSAFDWLSEKEKTLDVMNGADIAVIDSYLADLEFYEKVSSIVKTPVYIDDFKRIDYPRGIIVNGSIEAEKIGYSEKEGITPLLGTEYFLLRKEFRHMPEKEIKEELKSIMITFGGADKRGMTPKVLKLLRENYPSLKKNVIIGKIFRGIDLIEKEADSNTVLVYYPDGKKMKEVMLASDMAISAGGQTLYELARAGVPTLGICASKDQHLNVRGFYKTGFLEFVGWYNDNNLNRKIIEAMGKFLAREEREKSSSMGRKLVDGQGGGRVVNHILPST